jgi:3-oxoadipate enol-lactonase
MPTARVNDINIYYEIHGEGEPLVLIPGLSNDVSDYAAIVPRLSAKFRVIILDNRGAGRSDKPDAPYTIEMMADDVAGLLAALDIQEANVLGISMGGRIALDLALRHPARVKKLVLVSTSARAAKTFRGFLLLDVLSRISTAVFKGKYPQPYYAFVRQRAASRNYDCTGRLHEIRVPTLILHGRKDRIAPWPLAEQMHANIRGSALMAFKGGHVFLFFQPQPFADAVLQFLGTTA